MRDVEAILLDNAVSPAVAVALVDAGHDALHVRDVANLPALAADLEAGSVIVIEPSRIRIRRLPLG